MAAGGRSECSRSGLPCAGGDDNAGHVVSASWGVLADSFDRRWLLFTVQVYFFVVAIVLTVLTAAGLMPPALLLALTFALAIGAAVQLPTWQAIIPNWCPEPSCERRAGWIWSRSTWAVRSGRRWLV